MEHLWSITPTLLAPMSSYRRLGFCAFCESDQTFSRSRMSHGLHIMLSLASLGLWLVPYVAVWVHRSRTIRWRCTHCGHRFRVNGQRNGAAGEPKLDTAPQSTNARRIDVQTHEIPPPHAHVVAKPVQNDQSSASSPHSTTQYVGSTTAALGGIKEALVAN